MDKSVELVADLTNINLGLNPRLAINLMYLKEAKSIYKPLTFEEVKELTIKIQNGDKEAFETLVKANLLLVNYLIKKYNITDLDVNDLTQNGNLGLIMAVKKYDYEKGFRFSTYASWYILANIYRGINKTGRLIKLPNDICELLSKVNKTTTILEKEFCRQPTKKELANYLGESEENIELALIGLREVISIESPLSNDSEDTLEEIIPSFDSSVEDTVVDKIAVETFLEILKPKEREVLILRYGLNDGIKRSCTEVSKILNCSRSGVNRIELNALKKIRKYYKIVPSERYSDLREVQTPVTRKINSEPEKHIWSEVNVVVNAYKKRVK